MNNKIYWTVIAGVFILNMLGFLMDMTWLRGTGNPGYLAYDITYGGIFRSGCLPRLSL
jgi:hypothetical protein